MHWIMKLKEWLGSERTGNGKRVRTQKEILVRLGVIALIGIALLAGNKMITGNQKTNKAAGTQVFSNQDAKNLSEIKSNISQGTMTPIEKYESYVDQNLKNILQQIQGVSDVSVMVTFSTTEKKIYQNDVKTQDNQTKETDQKGGTRQVNDHSQDSQVVMVDKNGVKEPVVIGQEQPGVRGVVVVARGADQPAIQVKIMDAVATVLDIPSYKVKVLQKNE
ncbi:MULTISPECIES: stage III sporulation protein AG [unclassified Sporolactobacillus]|uniref:stage III sporulation protein AG n=1 Tax=unclassified Sporolactobacillus TaxID=2628533 RepID=UPI002367745E|nr:stage III sporulation protein AG [Sporolactobacillus sp. CQH2019]MDD9149296.1 stage III sporulation protein AG [Sporolactobacillus sp. CQH2019]